MEPKHTIFGIPLGQAIALLGLLAGVASVWVHLEIRLAELNIEIVNLKQELTTHKGDNRRDFELLHSEIAGNTREIVQKIDGIEGWLRGRK